MTTMVIYLRAELLDVFLAMMTGWFYDLKWIGIKKGLHAAGSIAMVRRPIKR